MVHRVKLKVHRAKQSDVFLDTIRIPKESRGSLEVGHFYRVSAGGKDAFAALRGSDLEPGTIRIDETLRDRLGVKEQVEYEFTLKKLNLILRLLPLLRATNPSARLLGWITAIGFIFAIIGVIPALLQFGCWVGSAFK